MADKRYQIFLSSTFQDLREVRSSAVNVIMRLGHIPAGMELFPATDKRQWAVIEKAIEESDYYVLIVGGRYGSVLDHRSYTEAEYDLAVQKGIPIIPLLAVDSDSIFQARRDEPEDHLVRLNLFRDRLGGSHTCQYWKNDAELSAQLFQGILEAIAERPREGWVRGSAAASDETLQRLVDVTAQRDKLAEQVSLLRAELVPAVEDIADLSDSFECRYDYTTWSRHSGTTHHRASVLLTWAEIFAAVGPQVRRPSTPATLGPAVVTYVKENKNLAPTNMAIFKSDADTIKVHLQALGLIKSVVSNSVNGGMTEFLELTALGGKRLAELLARRKSAG